MKSSWASTIPNWIRKPHINWLILCPLSYIKSCTSWWSFACSQQRWCCACHCFAAAAHEWCGKALDPGNAKQTASTHHLNANWSELAVWLCMQTTIAHCPGDPTLTPDAAIQLLPRLSWRLTLSYLAVAASYACCMAMLGTLWNLSMCVLLDPSGHL